MSDRNAIPSNIHERLRAFEAFQRKQAVNGSVPDVEKLPLRRWSRAMQIAVGLSLGLLVAMMALLVNFILFNLVIHIEG